MWMFVAITFAAQPSTRPSDAERGETLYRRHCNACHGPTNDGKGPLTTSLLVPVPALAGRVDTGDKAVTIVLKGQRAMPAYEATFDRFDAVRVLKFMAALSASKPLTDPVPAADPKKPDRKKPELEATDDEEREPDDEVTP